MADGDLDDLFELLDIGVHAFAVCEIGKNFALRCEPHGEVVLHFVLQGSGYVECQFGRYELRPAALIIIPRNLGKLLTGAGPIEFVTPAEASCSLSEGIVRFRACARPVDLVLGCATLSTSMGQYVPILGRLQKPVVAYLNAPQVTGLFSALLQEIREPSPGTRAFLSAVMKQLLILLLREHDHEAAEDLSRADHRLQCAAMAVLRAPAAPHSVDALAARAAMSRARFSECFSAAYGCPPMAFVQSARLAAAARLLRNSDLPIKAVAAAVGYASRSQFTRAFKERYGEHPTQFRH